MTDGTYILASYSCDLCEIKMPQIADQAGAGYFGWAADFVKEEAWLHMQSKRHLDVVAAEKAAQVAS